MKKKVYTWILISIVLLSCTALVITNQYRLQSSQATNRQAVLTTNKPLTDKVGGFVWLYGYKKGSTRNRDYIKSQVIAAHSTHLHYVVISILFNNKYVNKGKFDFEEFDFAIKAIKENGLVPIVVFSSNDSVDANEYAKNKRAVLNKYERLIRSVIIKYRDHGVIWQMWNEPNGLFWFNQSNSGTNAAQVRTWVDFNAKIFAYVRRYDPNSVFLAGAIAGNYSDSKQAMRLAIQNHITKYGDALANHPYLSSSYPDNGAPENLLKLNSRKFLLSLTADNSKKAVRSIPLVTTEMGYSMSKSHFGSWSEEDQANYLARSIFVLDMMHQPIISLYALVDEKNGSGEWGIYKGMSPHYVPKQSARLISQLLSNLDGYSFDERLHSDARDFVLKYKKNGQRDRIVCWTMDDEHVLKVSGQTVLVTKTPQIIYEK
ncbi:cellulase family glycosylhydrolase [Lactiplantibacillus plantarum]|uniref:cellulase family glycosylhydrolase n=1 Tax=Lactiplantibacillus plantarum TaxID=1590 RepID=UPI000977B0B3|nr:cellulase family glycosylhydrolase [Lactiplantibacillus plantarum]